MFVFLLVVLFVCSVGSVDRPVTADDKVPVDQIIAKNLESIGSEAVRAGIRTRMIGGKSQVTFRARTIASTDGAAVLASTGIKNILAMKFQSSEYPYEKLGFDGDKVSVYQLNPGDYSSLASFVRSYPVIVKDGLLGGTLSSAWPLTDVSAHKVKLESGGFKKVNSERLLEVKYEPRGGSDLQINLYFDPETFHHVRTVYTRIIAAQMGRTPEQSSRMTETRYELVEEFSDFKTESGMTLPHTYKIRLGQNGSSAQYSEWALTLDQFIFNQQISDAEFRVS